MKAISGGGFCLVVYLFLWLASSFFFLWFIVRCFVFFYLYFDTRFFAFGAWKTLFWSEVSLNLLVLYWVSSPSFVYGQAFSYVGWWWLIFSVVFILSFWGDFFFFFYLVCLPRECKVCCSPVQCFACGVFAFVEGWGFVIRVSVSLRIVDFRSTGQLC